MKVLPLILVLLIVISLSVREDLRSYRTEKEGRIDTYRQLLTVRERAWGETTKRSTENQSPPPGDSGSADEKEAPGPKEKKVASKKSAPATRELNIYSLVDPSEFSKDPDKALFLLRTIQKLFDKYFEKAPLYQSFVRDDKDVVAHLFEAIRDKFADMKFSFGQLGWEELALIKLDNEKLQLFLYEILKGEKIPSEKVDKAFRKGEKIPLMNSLRVDKSQKPLRLFTASPDLIETFLPLSHRESLMEILDERQEIAKLLRKNKDARASLDQRWEEKLKSLGIDLPKTTVTYEISSTKN